MGIRIRDVFEFDIDSSYWMGKDKGRVRGVHVCHWAKSVGVDPFGVAQVRKGELTWGRG